MQAAKGSEKGLDPAPPGGSREERHNMKKTATKEIRSGRTMTAIKEIRSGRTKMLQMATEEGKFPAIAPTLAAANQR